MEVDQSADVENLIASGKMDQALKLLENDKSTRANLKRSIIYEKLGEFDESLKYALLAANDPSPLNRVHSIICQSYVYWRKNNAELAEETIENGLVLLKDIAEEPEINKNKIIEYKAELLYIKGIITNLTGELVEPFEYFKQSYELREEINHPTKSHSLNAMGIIKEMMGELMEALRYHEMSLKIKREVNNIQDIYRSCSNMSELYHKTGDFQKALKYSEEGYELAQQVGNKKEELILLKQIGSLNVKLDQTKKAEQIFLDLLETQLEREDYFEISHIYQYLIRLYRKNRNNKEKEKYIKKFKDLAYSLENQDIKVQYQEEFALDLLNSDRILDQMKGLEMYKILVEESDFDINNPGNFNIHEYISILTQLIRGLLKELSIKYNDVIIDEIEEYIKQIEIISDKENLILTKIEILELKAKLEIIQGNIELARRLLIDAQVIAEEKGFSSRASHIAEEYDRIIIQNIHNKQGHISERVNELKMDDILSRISLDKPQPDNPIKSEQPIQIMILNSGGSPVYVYSFRKTSKLNEVLVGSFLSAIQAFGNEIFKDELQREFSEINRIEHMDYSIIIKNSIEQEVYIAYIFEGPSYHAVKKLLRFSDILKDNGQWDRIVKHPFSINHTFNTELNGIVESIFK